MKFTNDIEEAIRKKLHFAASAKMRERILTDVINAQEDSRKTKLALTGPNIWRIIMNNRITKFAAAAVIVIAVLLSMTFFSKTTPMTYAIEQTREANRGVRFIHLKNEPARAGHVEDLWAQFGDNQELLHLRMNFPNSSDGPKDVVWQEGIAEVWFKARKRIVVLREENMLARLMMSYKEFDPKLIVEQLYQAQDDERNQIEIQEPRSQNEPITITLVKDDSRMVYEVDSETKLLQQLEIYRLKDGDYTFSGRTSYLDYNQSVPDIFVLNPPPDVIRIDQITQEVGLAQGDLSDEEVAVEVARQFFEALIAEDYDKAGKMCRGIAGKNMQQMFGHMKYLRIISIGDAAPHPRPEPNTKRLVVPCAIEVEVDGQIREWKLDELSIRQVDKQPGRWSIFGGF